jgi:ABC-type Fe3+/spermidine/putrescine transport system ATPase subunit
VLESGETAHNVLEGNVAEAIFIGGMTRYAIRLRDGAEILVKQQTSSGRKIHPPGAAVRIGWSPDDTILLPRQADRPG